MMLAVLVFGLPLLWLAFTIYEQERLLKEQQRKREVDVSVYRKAGRCCVGTKMCGNYGAKRYYVYSLRNGFFERNNYYTDRLICDSCRNWNENQRPANNPLVFYTEEDNERMIDAMWDAWSSEKNRQIP